MGQRSKRRVGPRSCQPAGGAKGLLRFGAPETECPGGLVPTARRHGFLGSAQVWCDACGKGGGVFRAKPGTFSYLNGSFGALKADTSFERSC